MTTMTTTDGSRQASASPDAGNSSRRPDLPVTSDLATSKLCRSCHQLEDALVFDIERIYGTDSRLVSDHGREPKALA